LISLTRAVAGCVRILLAAIEQSARDRSSAETAGRRHCATQVKFQGSAYPNLLEWDDNGDNLAAVTALNVADHFREVSEIPRSR